MDILEFAMQAEKDGEKLYLELAEKSADPGIKSILNSLAKDEVKHHNILQDMKDGTKPTMADTRVLTEAKNVFVRLREAKNFKCDASEIAVYKQARELEKQSADFYTEKAGEAGDADQKELLLRIAEEEKKHHRLLDHMVEYLSRPRTWLENAEFNNLEDY